MSGAEQLLDSFWTVPSLEHAEMWKTAARGELARMRHSIAELERRLQSGARDTEEALKGAGVFRRNKVKRELEAKRLAAGQQLTALSALAERLQSAIAAFPTSSDDAKLRIKELKLEKKALNLQKKQLNAGMRDVRAAASAASARVGPRLTGLGKVGTGINAVKTQQRHAIRANKQAQLEPLQAAKQQLEEAILSLDHWVLWLERFK